MHGTPYIMRRRILLSPSRLPCTPPPFGTLVAIDLRTGAALWEVPLGSVPAWSERTGRDASARMGLAQPRRADRHCGRRGVHRGGARPWLHAYDIETGRELWRGALPASGKATPMSYASREGDQYVAIAVGGGDVWGTGDHVLAFRLPR